MCVCVCLCVCTRMWGLSCAQLFATPWTVAHQAHLSIGFPRQEYWSGLTFPPVGDLSHPGIELSFPALQVDSLPVEPLGKPEYRLVVLQTFFAKDQRGDFQPRPGICPFSGRYPERTVNQQVELGSNTDGWHHWLNGRESEQTPGGG